MPQVFLKFKLLLAFDILYCPSFLAFQGLHNQELRKDDGKLRGSSSAAFLKMCSSDVIWDLETSSEGAS